MSEFNYDPVDNILQHVAIEERQQKRIAELEAEVRETAAFLAQYGQHTDACAIIYEPKCTCGLNDILNRLEKSGKQASHERIA